LDWANLRSDDAVSGLFGVLLNEAAEGDVVVEPGVVNAADDCRGAVLESI
jgi:hypothetical protein